jgi:hypothetical protein
LGHTRYYRKFIRGYAQIIVLCMEKLLKKYTKYQWNDECQQSLDILKEKMVSISKLGKIISCACGCIYNSIGSSINLTKRR